MGRFARGVTVLLAIALLAASAASAATPTQIYRDYQDNGRLDGRYSVADLQAALSSPSVQGYGSPTITPGMKQEIVNKLGAQQGLQGGNNSGNGGLPFTGFDLALLTVGGALLLSVGFGLRRVARAKS
jgi:opacity protein-like surface antigen